MVDLTVIILTKNEEKNLRKCIESFQGIVRRFVIVDSYSTDGTEKLCKQIDRELRGSGSKLDFYQNKWISYAEQFNWGLSHTNIDTEWSMRMDADEELLPELANEIDQRLPNIRPPYNGIVIKRRVIFMGRWIKHGGRYPEMLLRIFRTGMGVCEPKLMDEHMILSEGDTIQLNHDLVDRNQKDLSWWIEKHNWYSNREVLDYQLRAKATTHESMESGAVSTHQAVAKRFIKNHGYYRLPLFLRAHLYFVYRYYIRLGFLDGPEGKIYHFLQAYWYRFLVDAKIYECKAGGKQMEIQGDLKA